MKELKIKNFKKQNRRIKMLYLLLEYYVLFTKLIGRNYLTPIIIWSRTQGEIDSVKFDTSEEIVLNKKILSSDLLSESDYHLIQAVNLV